MGGPRSNYSRLPQAVRSRILYLRHDGADYDEIRKDPEIAAACKERGFTLNNSTFLSVAFSRDLADFSERARTDEAARRADKIAQSVIQSDNSLEDLTDVARYELGKEIRKALADLPDDDDGSRIKALKSLAQSIAAVSGQHQADRIAALKRQVEELKRQAEADKAAWTKRESELLKRIADLENTPGNAGLSRETLENIEHQVKII